MWTGFSTTTSFPFLFSRPISTGEGKNVARERCEKRRGQTLEQFACAKRWWLRREKAKVARLRGLLDVWKLRL